MMDKKSLILKWLAIILGGLGTLLYLAAYFWGIFFIITAFVVYFYFIKVTQGSECVKQRIKKLFKQLYVPLIGILISILIGAVIMIFTGYNPITAYSALFYGGFIKNWHVSILNACPLIFTGLSIAFAFKAGLFNIGAEGQYYIGAMAAAFLGIYFKLPGVISIFLIFIIAGSLAAAYNYIPALLKVKSGASEVITTMMFAHIARLSSSVFIKSMGGDPSTSAHPYVTYPILDSNWLLRFKQFLPAANYRLHIGIIIAILTAIFIYYLLFYTNIGFEIRAVGNNANTARTQGISVTKNIFIALLIAGFLAGMAGINQVLGLDHKMFENLNAGYGFNGIAVALLASNHPIGVIFTGLLWGALDAGGQYMSRTVQTPNSIVEIIKGIILLLVVARYIYSFFGHKLRRLFTKVTQG